MKLTIEITQGDTRKDYKDIIREVEFITIPDNPFGKAGPSSIPMAYILKKRYRVKAIGTINTRDRNKPGIISEILAALEMQLDGLFVVSGDHSSKFKEVREIDVFQLLSLIKKYRYEYGSDMLIGATINLSRQNEIRFVKKKIENGADFFISQAIYDENYVKNNEWIKYLAVPVYAGFMPIFSKRMISFYKKGINISNEIEKRMLESEDLFQENLKIFSSILEKTKDYVEGYHIMPLGNVEFIYVIKRMVKKNEKNASIWNFSKVR